MVNALVDVIGRSRTLRLAHHLLCGFLPTALAKVHRMPGYIVAALILSRNGEILSFRIFVFRLVIIIVRSRGQGASWAYPYLVGFVDGRGHGRLVLIRDVGFAVGAVEHQAGMDGREQAARRAGRFKAEGSLVQRRAAPYGWTLEGATKLEIM